MAAQYPGISGRIFSVTGGLSGMGLATVSLLASHGAAEIWVADWNIDNQEKALAEVAAINPKTKVHVTKVDVSDSKQVDAWVTSIVSATGGFLHGAANVAGVPQGPLTATRPAILNQDDASWDRILGVNLNGVMYCTRAQVREMAKMVRGSNPSIVNVASTASLSHSGGSFAYVVSKGACAHFTGCVAKDVFLSGIRANTVSPGATETPMFKHFTEGVDDATAQAMIGHISGGAPLMGPSAIARTIVWLLSEQSLDVNGVNLPVGPGIP